MSQWFRLVRRSQKLILNILCCNPSCALNIDIIKKPNYLIQRTISSQSKEKPIQTKMNVPSIPVYVSDMPPSKRSMI